MSEHTWASVSQDLAMSATSSLTREVRRAPGVIHGTIERCDPCRIVVGTWCVDAGAAHVDVAPLGWAISSALSTMPVPFSGGIRVVAEIDGKELVLAHQAVRVGYHD